MSGQDEMSGRDDESCDIMRHHVIGSRSGLEAGGVRCHSTEGVAEERRGGGSWKRKWKMGGHRKRVLKPHIGKLQCTVLTGHRTVTV